MIVKMYTGSMVYGTALPESDTDIKEIFQPEACDIIMMQARHHYTKTTRKNREGGNTKDDVDLEGFSLSKFLEMVAEGQTIALDMLFTPHNFYLETSPIWAYIQKNKDRLISRQATAFVGYCRTQAKKYQVKAERVDLLHEILALLGSLPKKERLENIPQITALASNGYIEVCNRKCLLTFTVEKAVEIYETALTIYGQRVLAAASNGHDYKSLYHAVRVAREAEELLTTGRISFPRPEAPLLLAIRRKEKSYEEICGIIDEGLLRVEGALLKTTLPEHPDLEFTHNVVFEENFREVRSLTPKFTRK